MNSQKLWYLFGILAAVCIGISIGSGTKLIQKSPIKEISVEKIETETADELPYTELLQMKDPLGRYKVGLYFPSTIVVEFKNYNYSTYVDAVSKICEIYPGNQIIPISVLTVNGRTSHLIIPIKDFKAKSVHP